jgi:TPR repeat protein
VAGTTLDGLDKVESSLDVKEAGQTIVHIALQPVRNARLQTEQSAREEAAYLQDLRDHAADRFKKGSALAEQKRYGEARPLFQKACDGGDMVGCFDLALLYDNGDGGSQDYSQARTLYQRSCDGGDMNACFGLGSIYALSQGVSEDFFQARTFDQKACDGGVMGACFMLGLYYENGYGGRKDYAMALTLFQKACDGGEPDGCTHLQSQH